MGYDPEIHHRRSIRLQGCNYSQPGAYFITICSYNHLCLFGSIKNTKIDLSETGAMISYWWNETSKKFLHVDNKQYTIMPNHIHGIIEHRRNKSNLPIALSAIVRWFKTMTTNEYIRNSKTKNSKLWQRNYYEHVIRGDETFVQISNYIAANPLNWEKDKFFRKS